MTRRYFRLLNVPCLRAEMNLEFIVFFFEVIKQAQNQKNTHISASYDGLSTYICKVGIVWL